LKTVGVLVSLRAAVAAYTMSGPLTVNLPAILIDVAMQPQKTLLVYSVAQPESVNSLFTASPLYNCLLLFVHFPAFSTTDDLTIKLVNDL